MSLLKFLRKPETRTVDGYVFEYKTINRSSGSLVRQLNELGADGWELVSEMNSQFYLKRRIK